MPTTGKINHTATHVLNVKGRLSSNHEIEVEVPSDFLDFYNNREDKRVNFTTDNWYRTGITGKMKDGLLVMEEKGALATNKIEADIKLVIEGKCHYISTSLIVGADQDYTVAIVFPNNQMEKPHYEISPLDGCFCPKDMNELNKCLTGCLHDANSQIGQKFSKVKTFLIVEMNS